MSDEHWVEQLDAARLELAQAKRRQATDRNGTLKTVAAILAFTSLIFTAGYNWRRIDELLAWQTVHIAQTEKFQDEFVRKDLLTEQFKVLNERLDELQREIEKLDHTIDTRNTRKE